MADDCPCLIPDDANKCVDCGKHIEMPDVEAPNLGDIGGIIRLIDSTAKNYASLMKANSDPADPSQPRLRLIGGQFVRLPHNTVYKAVIVTSYVEARKLGYRGTCERWSEIIIEAAPDNHSISL